MKYTALQLKTRVMRRVYFIYWAKRILRPIVLKSTFLLGSLTAITTFVSVRHVLLNLLSTTDANAALRFMIDALTSAQAKVQLLVFVSAALAVWLARDLVRSSFSKELSYEPR